MKCNFAFRTASIQWTSREKKLCRLTLDNGSKKKWGIYVSSSIAKRFNPFLLRSFFKYARSLSGDVFILTFVGVRNINDAIVEQRDENVVLQVITLWRLRDQSLTDLLQSRTFLWPMNQWCSRSKISRKWREFFSGGYLVSSGSCLSGSLFSFHSSNGCLRRPECPPDHRWASIRTTQRDFYVLGIFYRRTKVFPTCKMISLIFARRLFLN